MNVYLDCGSGFTYTSSDLDGWTKEFTFPGEGIENCRNACLDRTGCTGFEYNHAGDEGYKCGTYTGGDSSIEDKIQKSSWTSCILGILLLLLLSLLLLLLFFICDFVIFVRSKKF